MLIDTTLWHRFYPGVQQVDVLAPGSPLLQQGTRFETNLAGQDVAAAVTEFQPSTRIAWFGGPKAELDSVAYHAWILTPTPSGCLIWTEETMRGPRWIELAKKAPDAFWLAHEKLLRDLANVAIERSQERG